MSKSIREITPFPIRPGMLLGRRYKVDRPLGKGGCGIVYAALDTDTRELVALKTFRDEFLGSPAQRKAFEQEARLWVSLGQDPFVLRARGVESFNGRLFLVMDLIAPDDMGRVTLMDHVRTAGAPLPIGRCLDWSIQFCLGMEHAVRHGLHCHRDIKPQNILISQSRTVKIADFGVASVKELQLDGDVSFSRSDLSVGGGPDALRASGSMSRTICGTPGYMAPEVYKGEGADMLSDIYSFGLVLWQMAAGSPDPPFAPERWVNVEEYLSNTYEAQLRELLPPVTGDLWPVIQKCTRLRREERYASFSELRQELETFHRKHVGPPIHRPQTSQLDLEYWLNRGTSMLVLERQEEALVCFEKAIELEQKHPGAWTSCGRAFARMGRYRQAESCLKKAIKLDPHYGPAWLTKGQILENRGKLMPALRSFGEALRCDPRDQRALIGEAGILAKLCIWDHARSFLDLALALDLQNAFVWQSRGLFFCAQGALNSAIADFHTALSLDPLSDAAWVNIGYACDSKRDHREAIGSYNKALEINPRSIEALANRGAACAALSDYQHALRDYDAALNISDRTAWVHFNKGQALVAVGHHEQAFDAFQLATRSDPRTSVFWYARGLAAAVTHNAAQARTCWMRAIERTTESDAGNIKRAKDLLARNSTGEPPSMLYQFMAELLPLWRPAQPRLSPSLPMAYRPPANHKRGSGFDDSALLGHDNIVKQVRRRTPRGNARGTSPTGGLHIQDKSRAKNWHNWLPAQHHNRCWIDASTRNVGRGGQKRWWWPAEKSDSSRQACTARDSVLGTVDSYSSLSNCAPG